MHLPYVQIANDLIRHVPDLAAELGVPEEKAGWGLVKLISWALSRCPDNAPPSANDLVEGPAAAEIIARAAGLPKKLAVPFVDACERFQPKPILERVPPGIRIRGLDRYDPAWGKNHPEEWREWKRNRAGTGPEPGRESAGSASKPEPQTQTQTQKQKESTAVAPPPENPQLTAAEQPRIEAVAESQAFFGWAQDERQTTVRAPPQVLTTKRDIEAWAKGYQTAKAAAGSAGVDLEAVWTEFLVDQWAQQRSPVCPWQAFISQPVLERCISRAREIAAIGKSRKTTPCAKCHERPAETTFWGFSVCYPCCGAAQSAAEQAPQTDLQAFAVAWVQNGRATT